MYSISPGKVGYIDAKEALSRAKDVLDTQTKLESGYVELKRVLGGFYQGAETNWDAAIGGLDWLSRVMKELGLSSLPNQLSELILKPDQLSKIGEGYQAKLEHMLSKVNERVSKLEWAMRSYTIEGPTLARAPLSKLETWLEVKTNPEDLRNWLSYQKASENSQKLGLTPFLTAAKERQVPAEILEDVFMRRLWKAWLADAYRESPSLADFEATSQERTIQEFQSIDKGLREVTVRLVRQNIAKSQPKAEAAAPGESQMGIILREARKKRRVMPLRKLFAVAPHLIQDLKPCMLMSPLSVASYLGTSPYHFDWVIFDEASQIPPADAVGSILRGTHLIVAGDDKQLPPTTFFQAEADYDDEDDQSPEEPLESVLDECHGTGFQEGLPQVAL